ncbi:hypothetical protein [Psychrobacter sp. DAB_AL62B]|nr:hypothetical protein [Psychrobacter sp. DAB_AL62B]
MAKSVPAGSERPSALTDEQREFQELRKQVKRLTMERDILNEEG